MNVHVNCMMKNEALLLEEVLPYWQEYDVDRFVFLDDWSTDKSVDVVHDHFASDEVRILHPTTDEFNEAANRSAMVEYSRANGADVIISLDADELLDFTFLINFREIIDHATRSHMYVHQHNVVGQMEMVRQDPAYITNSRDFVFSVKHAGKFDLSQSRYHTPRIPPIEGLPVLGLPKEAGAFIHLQALNPRFYALKQLWYKVFEYVEYGKSPEDINAAYDPVVNGLDFQAVDAWEGMLDPTWDDFDEMVFDDIAEQRGYVDYINKHKVDELITFGAEYL